MNLIRLLAVMDLFRKGEAVANKEAWKTGQITVTAVAGLIMALIQVGKAFGYSLPVDVDSDTITAFAGGTLGFINIVLTFITSEKVGILPAKT